MRVVIIEDCQLYREVLRKVLRENYPAIDLYEAEDKAMASALLEIVSPDVAYVDVCLPDGNGLDLIDQIRRTNGEAVIACCTSYDYPEYRKGASEHGADFFFPKVSIGAADILAVIEEGYRRAHGTVPDIDPETDPPRPSAWK